MKELIDALMENGYARGSATLSHIVADTMQDGQYSLAARANAVTLAKYEAQYGSRTAPEIRALYAIEQMDQCLANDDHASAYVLESVLAKARDALPLVSPLREQLNEAWRRAMAKWH